MSDPQNNVRGASGGFESTAEANHAVTYDELYLVRSLSKDPENPDLSPAAIQRLNNEYGVAAVVQALRNLRGFPPPTPVRSIYAYLRGMLREDA